MKTWWLYLIPIFLFVSSVLLVLPFFGKEIPSGHDVGARMLHQQLISKALDEGQFPVRWVEWMGQGAGHPLFLFYPSLFYYPGSLFIHWGVPVHQAIGIVILMGTLISCGAWVLLGKRHGNVWAGTLAAIIFSWLPYRLSQLYVRAAYLEYFAVCLIPVVLLGAELIVKKERKLGFPLLVFSLASMILLHQPTVFLFSLPLTIWTGWLIWKEKKLSLIVNFIGATLVSLLLTAGFLLPSVLEKKSIHFERLTAGYYDFHRHFATVLQLLKPSWGYGISEPGESDGMSFQIGVVALILVPAGIYLIRKKHILSGIGLILIILSIWGSTAVSLPMWESISVLGFVQYPWRFLGVAVLGSALIAFDLNTWIKEWLKQQQKLQWLPAVTLAFGALVIGLSWSYRQPRNFFTTETYSLVSLEQKGENPGIEEGYLPVTLKAIMSTSDVFNVISGKAEVAIKAKAMHRLELRVKSEGESIMRLNIPYFPGWRAMSMNLAQPLLTINSDENGYMVVSLPPGEYDLTIEFVRTPIREVADLISVLTFMGILIFQFLQMRNHKVKGA